MPKKLWIVSLLFSLLLSACSVSLAADVTPPPTYKTPTPAQVQPASSAAQPLLPPDPGQGAAVYEEKCTPCHGEKGLGDGPQAAKLGLPVPAIGSVQLGRLASPADWYQIVSEGRMERGMPPFRSLTDRQRWDVVAYSLSLSATPASLQQGRLLYEAQCASCHGATGRGDGAAAPAGIKMPDWSQTGHLSQRSAADLVQVINTGVAPGMPAFAGKLSEDQGWALADTIRTFSFASGTAVQGAVTAVPGATQAAKTTPLATAQGTPAVQETTAAFTVTIAGQVSNASGEPLPAGLQVTLQGYDAMALASSKTAEVQPDGSYRFEAVEVVSGRTFLASVEVQKVPFDSQPLHAADLSAGQEVSLPITITEMTSDASALTVQRMHVFFDLSQPGTLQVAELMIITNPGTKAVVPDANGKPVIHFIIPPGAQDLSFQDGALGGRYMQTEQGFGDLTPVLPQSQLQVLFGYSLPYAGQQSVTLTMTMPVESTVVMIPSGGIAVKSAQLMPAGERSVDGTNIQLFTANALPKDGKIEVSLSGQAGAGLSDGAVAPLNDKNEIVIGIGIFGFVLIAAGFWLYRQRRMNGTNDTLVEEEDLPLENEQQESAEALLDAIVALDDLHQAGELPEAAYQQRRAELKERIRQLRQM